jgi:hypothetical protein
VGAVIDALMNAAAVAIIAKSSKPNLEYEGSMNEKNCKQSTLEVLYITPLNLTLAPTRENRHLKTISLFIRFEKDATSQIKLGSPQSLYSGDLPYIRLQQQKRLYKVQRTVHVYSKVAGIAVPDANSFKSPRSCWAISFVHPEDHENNLAFVI